MKAAKKQKGAGFGYEEDLEDDDLNKALEESKKASKKKKKKNNEPDSVLVESITEQFGGYFNQI